MRLYVIRHGETDLNVTKRIQGPLLDPPLNARGQAQVQALAQRFLTDPSLPAPDFVVSSTMRRATMTAEAIVRARPVPWEVDERLVEYDWGVWNGQVDEGECAAAVRRYIGLWAEGRIDEAPEKGESPRQVARRALDAVEARIPAVGPDGVLAVVAHGRLNKVLLAQLLDGSPARQEAIHQHNASITLLERAGERWTPVLLDDHSHVRAIEGQETV